MLWPGGQERAGSGRKTFPRVLTSFSPCLSHTLNASPKLRLMMMPPTNRPIARSRLCVVWSGLGCVVRVCVSHRAA